MKHYAATTDIGLKDMRFCVGPFERERDARKCARPMMKVEQGYGDNAEVGSLYLVRAGTRDGELCPVIGPFASKDEATGYLNARWSEELDGPIDALTEVVSIEKRGKNGRVSVVVLREA